MQKHEKWADMINEFGGISPAAKFLGVSRNTLYTWIGPHKQTALEKSKRTEIENELKRRMQ